MIQGTMGYAVQIFSSDHFRVEVFREDERLEITRSERPFRILQDFVAELEALLASIDQARAGDLALLYDSRLAPTPPGRTYRKAVLRMIEQLARRFSIVAVVLSAPEALSELQEEFSGRIDCFANPAAARVAIGHQLALPRPAAARALKSS
jgi:hypothetical protein